MTKETLDKLVEFAKTYLKYDKDEVIREYIRTHLKFNTFYYGVDSNGDIMGVCRWNVSDDGETAYILDMAVREDFRKKGIGRDFLIRCLKLWDKVKYLKFQRGIKGDQRMRTIPVNRLLKHSF